MTLTADGASGRRRILLLVTDLEIGGTPAVVRELALRMNAPPRTIINVACLARRGPVADQIETAGVHVTPLNASSWLDLGVIARLARLIHVQGCDTVFSFLVHANAAAAAVTPFFPTVRFLQSIQTTQPTPRWHWLVQSLVTPVAERVVVPSPSVARVAEDWADVPRSKLVVIANAIDPNEFAIECPTPPADHQGPVPIGFIGRLDPVKRIPDLLQAVRLLGDRVNLHVFGEGRERPILEKLVQELQLERRVRLHGAVARPQDALRQIKLLVLPSAAEGFGMVLIEAMAAGVPVVATKVPGIRDVVVDGETGILVPPQSPAALAQAIGRVIGDIKLRKQLVAAGRREVIRRFSWDTVLPQYRALLNL